MSELELFLESDLTTILSLGLCALGFLWMEYDRENTVHRIGPSPNDRGFAKHTTIVMEGRSIRFERDWKAIWRDEECIAIMRREDDAMRKIVQMVEEQRGFRK